ncbi:CRISPR-associated endonuclease Cas2 [Bifidobacterium olomucense]|uniref:CRISPR-associated endoribonuclease Cas2 n=1 Tax=Bifidobacterium olomucense TaxID=2675324 RepID=A0A7Y0EZG3_9BIFI|nr:CRISPR-associated endonuclease Cas2 [Bifidobacterium sp. DSM 109959]NMM99232.1 CRISPR-associated endonuclease Cas2 [Bifidobacterium sp. DSM 109959]
MMVVVAYDVNTETASGRRRLRLVSKACMKYGQRVQNSVFECSVSPSDYLQLRHELDDIIDMESDSLRFYNLGAKYADRIENVGKQRHLPVDDVMLI